MRWETIAGEVPHCHFVIATPLLRNGRGNAGCEGSRDIRRCEGMFKCEEMVAKRLLGI